MSKFCEKIVKNRPDIIGHTCWFRFTKNRHLECIINDDGTISIRSAPTEKFVKSKALIDAIKNGSVQVENFALPTKMGHVDFSNSLFVSKNLAGLVRYYVEHPNIPIPIQEPESSNLQLTNNGAVCPGFAIDDFRLKVVNCSSVKVSEDIARSKFCKGFKRVKQSLCHHCANARRIIRRAIRRLLQSNRQLCHGVKRDKYEDVIKSRKWEGERKDLSSARFLKNHLFSIKCSGEKGDSKKFLCCPCIKMQNTLRSLKRRDEQRKTSETDRLLCTGAKYLSTSDRAKRAAILRRQREERIKKLRRDLELARKPITPKQMENLTEVVNSIAHEESACEWLDANGVQCGHKAATRRMLAHVTNVHIAEQKNRVLNMDSVEIPYRCGWKNCKSDPVTTWQRIYLHVQTHVGPLKKLQRPGKRNIAQQRRFQAATNSL